MIIEIVKRRKKIDYEAFVEATGCFDCDYLIIDCKSKTQQRKILGILSKVSGVDWSNGQEVLEFTPSTFRKDQFIKMSVKHRTITFGSDDYRSRRDLYRGINYHVLKNAVNKLSDI